MPRATGAARTAAMIPERSPFGRRRLVVSTVTTTYVIAAANNPRAKPASTALRSHHPSEGVQLDAVEFATAMPMAMPITVSSAVAKPAAIANTFHDGRRT